MAARALARLFGDVAAFVDHYERRDVLVHHTEGFDDLFGIDTADRLIGAGALRVPFDARMANAVDETGATTAERWREAMRGTSPEPFEPDAAIAGFDRGDTIVLHALHRRVPALDRLASELEHEIGQTIDVNAFLTPPSAQGLDAHYDHHDVMILQVHGAKTWHLWSPRVEHPLPEYAPEQFEVEGDPRVVTLEVGDVMYVPRGWTHAATTQAATSLHLTVGIIPIPWLEVAHSFLSSLDREESLRRALPLGHHRQPSLLDEGIEQTISTVRQVLTAVDVGVAAKELAESFVPRRSTRVGRLAEVVGAHEPLHADTPVRLGSRALLGLCDGDAGWQITLGGVAVALPESLQLPLDRLRGGATMALHDVVGAWDLDTERLARQLLRHGVIAPAERRRAT